MFFALPFCVMFIKIQMRSLCFLLLTQMSLLMKITPSYLPVRLPVCLHLYHNYHRSPFKSLNSGFHASKELLWVFLDHMNDSHPLGLL